MVDKNDGLLREVQEELRRERMEKLWEKYGVYVLSAAVVVLALVGGWKYMEQKARTEAEAGGAKYVQAMTLARAGKEDEASKIFQELSLGKQPGYSALADLKLIGSHLQSGRPKDAFDALEKLAGRSGVDPMVRGFAQVQAAGLRLGEADFTEMQNRLTPLTVPGGTWRLMATELLGTAAYRARKLPEARALLSPLLSDPMLSKSAVERVLQLMTAIKAAEQPSAAAPKAEMPAAAAPGAEAAPAAVTSPAAPAAVTAPGPAPEAPKK